MSLRWINVSLSLQMCWKISCNSLFKIAISALAHKPRTPDFAILVKITRNSSNANKILPNAHLKEAISFKPKLKQNEITRSRFIWFPINLWSLRYNNKRGPSLTDSRIGNTPWTTLNFYYRWVSKINRVINIWHFISVVTNGFVLDWTIIIYFTFPLAH